jgi:hypothetical protein
MTDLVKLTVRIPPRLHERLKKRARNQDCSLNQVILKTLEKGLEVEQPIVESPRERALRVLRQHNMIAEPGAGRKLYEVNEPELTNAELREMLKGVPPLSDAIIEEREPR